MPFLREVAPFGIEPARWTVVFHRKAENRFFSAIAMGHFKHVSAFAWIPELSLWLVYDVGFRRTRLKVLEDGQTAQRLLAAIVTGNAAITIDARDTELPWMRLGMFCTSAVAHLIGIRSGALRPDTLFRHLKAKGGEVRDYGSRETADRRGSEPRSRAGEGAGDTDQCRANAGAV